MGDTVEMEKAELEYEFDPVLWQKVLELRGKAAWVAASDSDVVASGDDAREVLKEGALRTTAPVLIRVPPEASTSLF